MAVVTIVFRALESSKEPREKAQGTRNFRDYLRLEVPNHRLSCNGYRAVDHFVPGRTERVNFFFNY